MSLQNDKYAVRRVILSEPYRGVQSAFKAWAIVDKKGNILDWDTSRDYIEETFEQDYSE